MLKQILKRFKLLITTFRSKNNLFNNRKNQLKVLTSIRIFLLI